MELWAPHESLPPDTRGHGYPPSAEMKCAITGRVLSCFNASASLCEYLYSAIVFNAVVEFMFQQPFFQRLYNRCMPFIR